MRFWWFAFVLAAVAAAQTGWLSRMEARADHYGQLSRQIWELAEVGYQEHRSAALLKDDLRGSGFTIAEAMGGMPTAFTATWGSGKPVIAILAEYDALPGLSQRDVPRQEARVAGQAGHGCGHNLLGTAAVWAAIAAKEQIEARGLHGTLRVYGTPAEEGGSGKVFLIHAGAFRDVDAALAWHPSDQNGVNLKSNLAVIAAKFKFFGKPAHAAMAPETGRSALDGALVMLHAVELLREHVPPESRLHYVISNGGSAPNIVPAFSEVHLYARHPDAAALDGIWKRVLKCAEAGALATETRMEVELISTSSNILPNDALTALVGRNLRTVGGYRLTAEEQAFADELRQTLPGAADKPGPEMVFTEPVTGVDPGSTDFGDVSWVVPGVQMWAATLAPGVPLHSWQSTACSGMSIGRKGMQVAAKTLALSAVELLEKPTEVEAARAAFEKRRAGRAWTTRIPAGAQPPLHYRDK